MKAFHAHFAAWAIVGFLAIAAAVFIGNSYERPLRLTRSEIVLTFQQIESDREQLRRSRSLRLQEHEANEVLGPVSSAKSTAASAALAMDFAQTLARRLGVRLTRFDPKAPEALSERGTTFVALQVAIEVRGAYAPLMHFASDLTRGPALLGIDGIRLERDAGKTLLLSIDATLGHLHSQA